MKCDCECHCGVIPSRDAMNDKLYWIEILVGEHRGEKSTAWRDSPNGPRPWLVVAEGRFSRRAYTDDEIRIIHEITPEE